MSQDTQSYPTGQAALDQINGRHQRGTMWRTAFLASTIVGILALTALIYNIVNEAFGLVAVENTIEPAKLVRDEFETLMLNAPNTVSSEDDNEIIDQITNDPNGIGFIGFAFYQENSDQLNLVSVNGVEANAETAGSGEYPITRPLYLYTTADVLQNNQAASVYINYYLSNVTEEIGEVGYFPVDLQTLSAAQIAYIQASGLNLQPGQWAVINPEGIGGNVQVAGSSTVFPLSQQIANKISADGFAGNIAIDSVGTSAGLRALCVDGTADIANASRPIQPAEFNACSENGREPIEIRVGTDALAIVVNSENSFLQNATQEELQQLFTTAENWSDVNASWPNQPINRYVPGINSGTLDFFTETIFDFELSELSQDQLVKILATNVSSGRGRALEREQKFYSDRLVFESPEVWNEVCQAEGDIPSGCTDRPRSQGDVYDLVIREVVELDVVETWPLVQSILNRSAIEATIAQEYPNASLEFRSWLTGDFVTSPQSSTPEFAGVRTAILGSLWVVLITVLFSFPVGVGAAVYLEEYAEDNFINRLIQTNINNLAGVPSIIYGLLGLTIFVRVLEVFTSGRFFGLVEDTSTASGRTIVSAGLTLGLLILPVIIIASQEAIRAVPNSMRQAGMALGATKWQTIWHHILPSALPGIMTGTILAVARAVGETAP
ncbi:MAG: phosphate ABC transporter permease PstA, partial [Chloroflexota bacterium]